MITKWLWNELTFELRWYKNHKGSSWQSWETEKEIELYVQVLLLALFTPLVLALEILIFPLELGFCVFRKLINKK